MSYFNTYSWHFRTPFQNPLIIERKNVDIKSPVSSKSASLVGQVFTDTPQGQLDLGAISDKIYQLESSGGKNDGCRDLGLFNGYGFRQNTFEWKCYSSHEEVREQVIAWLEGHIKQGDLEKALCMYNEGKDEKSCRYSINYQSL